MLWRLALGCKAWYMYMQAPAISTKRGAHLCEVLDNKMYIMGGYGGSSGPPFTFLSTTEVYDPRANAWREGPDMGGPRAYGNSGIVDGSLFVFGGMHEVCTHYNRKCLCVCARHLSHTWQAGRGTIFTHRQGKKKRWGQQRASCREFVEVTWF
jgi:hypothetical protein